MSTPATPRFHAAPNPQNGNPRVTATLRAAAVHFAIVTSEKAKAPETGALNAWKTGAGDEIRTHDPNLGKVVLYP